MSIQHRAASKLTNSPLRAVFFVFGTGPGISDLAVATKHRCVPSVHLAFRRCADTGGYHTAPGRSRDTKRCPWKANAENCTPVAIVLVPYASICQIHIYIIICIYKYIYIYTYVCVYVCFINHITIYSMKNSSVDKKLD